MRKHIFTVCLSLSLLLVACGEDSDTDGSGQSLSCDSISWCTNYGGTNNEVDAPAFDGGEIPDGLYRLEEGSFVASAFLFQGNEVILVGDSGVNQSGTYSTDGGLLTINLEDRCDVDGSEANEQTLTYDFVVSGDDLFLVDRVCSDDAAPECQHRYARVSNLCDDSQTFTCTTSTCSCSSATSMQSCD